MTEAVSRFGSVGVAASVAVHLAVFWALGQVSERRVSALEPSVVDFEVAKPQQAPAPEPEPEPEFVPEPVAPPVDDFVPDMASLVRRGAETRDEAEVLPQDRSERRKSMVSALQRFIGQ